MKYEQIKVLDAEGFRRLTGVKPKTFERMFHSPYARDEFFKFCNSKKAARLAFSKRRFLIAK